MEYRQEQPPFLLRLIPSQLCSDQNPLDRHSLEEIMILETCTLLTNRSMAM